MKPRFDGISFDAVGTLFGLAEPVGVTYSRFARNAGFNVAAEAIDSGFRKAWIAMTDSPPEGVGGEKQWWRQVVELTFEKAVGRKHRERGIVSDQMFHELFAFYGTDAAWQLYPDTRPALERLAPNFQLVVTSNFDQRLLAVLEEFGIGAYFDAVVISDEVGVRKPGKRIFEAAAAKLGLEISHLLHVGDDPICDWQGAENAGCGVFRLDRDRLTLNDVEPE